MSDQCSVYYWNKVTQKRTYYGTYSTVEAAINSKEVQGLDHYSIIPVPQGSSVDDLIKKSSL